MKIKSYKVLHFYRKINKFYKGAPHSQTAVLQGKQILVPDLESRRSGVAGGRAADVAASAAGCCSPRYRSAAAAWL
jgi:hypothetical protein